jgi:hypothetical protein
VAVPAMAHLRPVTALRPVVTASQLFT